MPPKTKKAVAAAKKKIVEDRTFGLKNKNKSKKVAQFVKTVEHNVKNVGKTHKQLKTEEQVKSEKIALKLAKEAQDLEMAGLFKVVAPTQKQIIHADVDPKTVLCAFFKAGSCKRGAKCKFSHDLKLERRGEKMSLYHDAREEDKDTIDKWDQAKLEDVINKKAGKITNETQIVCKFFLDAIESQKYGWFWQCPTEKEGKECIYKHRLPAGFVFRPKAEKKQDDDEEDDKLTIVEEIEEERKQLDLSKCTMVTLESFQKWKAEKLKKKEAETEQRRKEEAKKSGTKGHSVLSGRDLFKYDPSLFVDDADAAGDDAYAAEAKDETEDDLKKRLAEEQEHEQQELDRRKQAEEAAAAEAAKEQEAKEAEEDAHEAGEEAGEPEDAAPAKTNGSKPATKIDASLFEDDGALPEDDE
jgi:hypothetical protein